MEQANAGIGPMGEQAADVRAKMIEQHMPFVRFMARRFAKGASPHNGLDLEDLVSHGMVGLIQAVDRFETGHGVKFQSFAAPRIRGAMVDALRTLDYLPRTARAKATTIERTSDDLVQGLGRAPRPEEVRCAAGMTEREYRDALVAKSWSVTPFESVHPGAGDDAQAFVHEPAADLPDASANLERAELLAALAAAVEALPERERQIIALHFQEGLTLTEIASIFDVSLTRISQLYRRAIERLRLEPAIGYRAA